MKAKNLILAALLAAVLSLNAGAATTTIIPSGATPVCPAQASAVGFTNLVFDDEFTTNNTFTTSTSATGGYNWYPYYWMGATSAQITVNTGTGTGSLAGATGYATITGANIATVITNPGQGGAMTGAYQHGYFEARIQFNPSQSSLGQPLWPAFWLFGTSAYIPPTSSAWTTTQTAEDDFFEAYPVSGGFFGCNTLHNWQHTSGAAAGTDLYNTSSENDMLTLVGSSESAQPKDGAWHTIGCLWVATSGTTGYVQYYLDNYLIAHENGVTQFLTGAGTNLPAQELDHMVVILGASSTQPMNVDWVHVWQSGGSSSSGSSGSSGSSTGTLTQTITGFPSTLSLSTTQSPYSLPATTSAGLALTYTIASGPATVSGNVLSLNGAGTVIVNASQAGNSSYAPYSGGETVTVTTPGTQTLANFPSTLSLFTLQSPYTLTSTTTAGLTVTYKVASGPATVSGNTLTLTGTGTVVLAASQAGNSAYAAYSGSETITVSSTPQTIANFPATLSLNPAQSPYTMPATTSAGLTISYSVTSGPATVNSNTLTLTGTGTVVVLASQSGNANYASVAETETITVVSLIPQTVASFPATLSLLTTQTPYTLPVITSASLPLTYSVVSGPGSLSGNTLTLTGAGTVVLTATQAGNTTYASYSGEEAITVTAATQTVTDLPATLSLTTAQSPYALPATTSAGLTLAYTVQSGPATVSGDSLTLTGTGTVVVKASQAGNATYASYSGTETITVSSLPQQTVASFPASSTYTIGSAPISLPATTSAGLSITYSVVSGPATISGDTLTITGSGTVVLSATQAGNGSYSAYSGTETITVNSGSTETFAQWEAGYFTAAQLANTALTGPTATPENDGVPNLLKYLYDIDPATSMISTDYAAMPATDVDTTTTPGTTYLTLTYRQYAKVTGITIQVQTSPDLQNWTTVTPTISRQTGTDSVTGDPIIEDEVNTNGATSEFIRLNVTSP
jgi:hypothetical protein